MTKLTRPVAGTPESPNKRWLLAVVDAARAIAAKAMVCRGDMVCRDRCGATRCGSAFSRLGRVGSGSQDRCTESFLFLKTNRRDLSSLKTYLLMKQAAKQRKRV